MGGWGCTTGRSGPDCTVGPRSGRDCAVTRSFALQGGILSNTGGKDGPGAFREDSGRVLLGISPELILFSRPYWRSALPLLTSFPQNFGCTLPILFRDPSLQNKSAKPWKIVGV